jgi:hypothetical protein
MSHEVFMLDNSCDQTVKFASYSEVLRVPSVEDIRDYVGQEPLLHVVYSSRRKHIQIDRRGS